MGRNKIVHERELKRDARLIRRVCGDVARPKSVGGNKDSIGSTQNPDFFERSIGRSENRKCYVG